MQFETTIELNNGVKIPQLGLGTALISEDEGATVYALLRAIALGYRHLDTASIYGNETAVGRAMRESGLHRSDFFLTTKLWTTSMRAGRTREAFEESLARLDTDYVDLYLLHWPVRNHYVESWQQLEALYEERQARAIGVSNFNPHHIDDLIALGGTIPAVNQYELHPQMACPGLRSYCRNHGIVMEACQPLGQGLYIHDPVLKEIGAKYGKTAAQTVIRWGLQHSIVTIPKSSHPQRMEENCKVYDFELSSGDMAVIDHMNINRSVVPDADPETFTF